MGPTGPTVAQCCLLLWRVCTAPARGALTSTAAMIKADIGLECLQLDINGWDHHSAQGPQDGLLATMLDDVSQGLDAF